MKPIALVIPLLALAGCMQPNATVTERNNAGLRIQTAPGTAAPIALTRAQLVASRYCAAGGKQTEYSDTRLLRNGAAEHYFLCY